jgi:hypothetical protein
MDMGKAAGRYRVTVEKSEQYWLIDVEGVGVTQARVPAEMDLMARDLVACMTDEDPAGISLIWPITVRAERWDGGWELHVGDIGVTQSTTLAEAEQQVRDYLESLLGAEIVADLSWDVTAAERAAAADSAVAEEVDDFTDALSVTQRAHQTISLEQLHARLADGTL